MKQLILNTFFCLFFVPGFSQITIDYNDMPAQGDTLRVSVTNQISFDYTRTGFDTTWDFSSLVPVSQNIESFVDPITTPMLYWPVFTPYTVTTLASPGGQAVAIPGLVVSDPYTFYDKSVSYFKDLGAAVTIMGIPIPAKYDSPDIYYHFPLRSTTGTWSTLSNFSADFPGIGLFSLSRSRTSKVDGWGTIITPFGTFQALRIKSHRIEHDSVFIDSLGIGTPVDRDITEYKWLAKGQGIPVLQVNSEGPSSIATYRDIYRQALTPLIADLGPDTTTCIGRNATLTVHVSGGVPPYRYLWNTLDTTRSVTVRIDSSSTFIITVFDALNNFSVDSRLVNAINCEGISRNDFPSLKITPNPTSGLFFLEVPSSLDVWNLQVLSSNGTKITEKNLSNNGDGKFSVDFTGYPSGSYILRLKDGSKILTGKLILIP
jgi:hypothetical protein